MGWAEHAIWWHVYPLGFVGAPIRGAVLGNGDRPLAPTAPTAEPQGLRRLLPWLDYAVELGVSGLLLGPIFTSSSHGYDSLDQFQIDPRLGTLEDFDELLAECKKRGLRVVLDGVFSHVGEHHPLVAAALAAGPDSPEARLVDIDWSAQGGPRPRVFEGHGSLVRLNHATPEATEYTQEVMLYWLNRGIDGWRLDAAYSVSPWFWHRVIPQVRTSFPESWFLAEVIHGDYAEFVKESSVDSVTQYELWKAIWSSLLDRNFFELEWSLKRHNEFLESFIPNTFVGNHDVTRIASTLGANRAVIAFMILMTVGGIPSIYYGDEQGFTGVKEERLGGDDAVRPPMPGSPSELSSLGDTFYACYRDLIGIRRRNSWLTTASVHSVSVDNDHYVYRSVSADPSLFLEVDLDLKEGGDCVIRDASGNLLWGKPDL